MTTDIPARTTGWSSALRTAAVAAVAAAALAGCGPAKTPSAATSSVAAPSAGDSNVSVVPPVDATPDAGADASRGVTAPNPGSGTGSGTGSDQPAAAPPVGAATGPGGTATSGQAVPERAPSATTVPGHTAPGHTVPGLPDGAVALPRTTQVSADGRCRLTALDLQPVDLQGSPGGTYADFRLVNVSKTACAVRGYVTATLLGDAGNAIATTVRHEASPEAWVKIVPKGSAQFHLRFPNPMSGDTPCNPPNAARVRIGLPGTSGTLTSSTPDGGIQACHGELSTAPLGST